MNEPDSLTLKVRETLRLVKWDGDAPEGVSDPYGHPQCSEILEQDLQTGEVTVIYRRN